MMTFLVSVHRESILHTLSAYLHHQRCNDLARVGSIAEVVDYHKAYRALVNLVALADSCTVQHAITPSALLRTLFHL